MVGPEYTIFSGSSFYSFAPGDIWWVRDLPQQGTREAKGRPVVILSHDESAGAPRIVYLKITSQPSTRKFPRELLVDWEDEQEGLSKRSYVQVDLPRAIPIEALGNTAERRGQLTQGDQLRVSRLWHEMAPVRASRQRSVDDFERMAREVLARVSTELVKRYEASPKFAGLERATFLRTYSLLYPRRSSIKLLAA